MGAEAVSDAKLVAEALREAVQDLPDYGPLDIAADIIERRLAEREQESRGRMQDGQSEGERPETDAGSHPAPSTTLDELIEAMAAAIAPCMAFVKYSCLDSECAAQAAYDALAAKLPGVLPK